MVKKLYSEFDASITIRSEKGKTFDQTTFPYQILTNQPEIKNFSKAIEEIVILKHGEKWINATLYGIQKQFITMSNMRNHMVDGDADLKNTKGAPLAIGGVGLLNRLQAYTYEIPENSDYIEVYFPLRDTKLRIGSDPFNNEFIQLAGSYNYNREVNSESLVVPLDFAQKYLDYGNDITCIYVKVKNEKDIQNVQQELKKKLGKSWKIKTQYEKNELIYKTSKTEKLIVIGILLFVFAISTFNLMTALIMSILEKKRDILTMYSFGMTKSGVFRIFFYNGMMVALKGIILGLILGFVICGLQIQFRLLKMPNSGGEFFPIQLKFTDGILIFSLVFTLSILTAYLPVKFLLKKINR